MPTHHRAFSINPSVQSMKRLFFKFPNFCLFHFPHSHSVHNRHLRVADILLSDEEEDAAVYAMDGARETPAHASSRPIKCYSPRRLVAWLLAALRPSKERRILQRRQKMPSSPIIDEPKGSQEKEEPRQLDWNDASFKLGVGCGLLYMIAATKNELGKMVELRKEMETLLQNMKAGLQSKDAIFGPIKQSDALSCSITDVQEVSCSNSHLSIHSQTPHVQPESKRNVVRNQFIDYNIVEQDESAEGVSELQAEFEYELQRLQLYLDGEAALEDSHQERVEVTFKDSSSRSHGSGVGEIIMEPQIASSDVSFGVPPIELERRLHELLEARLQERITELECALEYTTRRFNEKVVEVTWWEDTARLIPQHVPETSRFTFPLDPETALKLSQVME